MKYKIVIKQKESIMEIAVSSKEEGIQKFVENVNKYIGNDTGEGSLSMKLIETDESGKETNIRSLIF